MTDVPVTLNFDHLGSPPLEPAARAAMLDYLDGIQGTPLSSGPPGDRAAAALDAARGHVGRLLGGAAEGVLFTASGTEANNTAVKGLAWAAPPGRRRLIVSAVEHVSVLYPARFLEKHGFVVEPIPVDGSGRIDPEDLKRRLGADAALVAVQAASNEIGTAQPVAEAGRLCAEHGVPLLVDAVVAAGRLPIDVERWRATAVSIAAHQLGGPRGAGALWLRPGTRLVPLLHGGIQEEGRRAGAENVAAIAGLGEAARVAAEQGEARLEALRRIGEVLRERVAAAAPDLRFTGHPAERLAGHVSVVAPGVEGESLVLALALEGVLASTGSTCLRADLASHVHRAIGLSPRDARGSLVLSAGPRTTEQDIQALLPVLQSALRRLRALAP